MGKVEVSSSSSIKENKMPKFLAIIGGGIIGLYALYLGLMGLLILGTVFSISMAVGIIMILTAVGMLSFAPMWIAFSMITVFEGLSDKLMSSFEYWTKAILLFIGCFVVPYIALIACTFIVLAIAGLINNFVT